MKTIQLLLSIAATSAACACAPGPRAAEPSTRAPPMQSTNRKQPHNPIGVAESPASMPPDTARLLDELNAKLHSADEKYDNEFARAKELISARMAQARELPRSKGIAAVLKALPQDPPDPALGEHHAESAPAATAPKNPATYLAPSEARAALLSYKADLELARRRWLDDTADIRHRAGRTLADEFVQAQRNQNKPLAEVLRPVLERLRAADRGDTTAWYRENIPTQGSDAIRSIPVAMAFQDVHITAAVVGEQFRGSFNLQTLIQPYNVSPRLPGPVYCLLIYEGDHMIFFAGGAWNGAYNVDQDRYLEWDTHSNVLSATHGKKFVFTKTGTFTMRLIAENDDPWGDILAVYQTDFTVTAPASRPAITPTP